VHLDDGAGVELQVAEAVAVGEQRLDAQHDLPGAGRRQARRDGGEASRTSSTVAECSGAPSSARKRLAVRSQLRRLCAELSEATQEAASASSVFALMAAIACTVTGITGTLSPLAMA
jgi:hypothetical protein